MRFALAQINPTVGDVAGNAKLIRDAIDAAADGGARVVVFPELAVLGYPPKDLLLKPAVIERCVAAVEQLASYRDDIAAIIGYPCPAVTPVGRPLHNAVVVCDGGQVVAKRYKSLLPTYDVFDEHRYFEPAGPDDSHDPVTIDGVKIGLTVCEDLWNDDTLFDRPRYHVEPVQRLADAGADVIINCSASPFVLDKHNFRQNLFKSAARRAQRPLLFCNQVGGNDELVFDGNSCAIDATGDLIAHGRDFDEDLLFVEIDPRNSDAQPNRARIDAPRTGVASVYHALVLGLRDYCRKCGFKSVVVGLSGGIDSAVTAALCVAALGREQVRGITMPSRYSSEGSVTDAQDLAERLNIRFDNVPIETAHNAFTNMLADVFAGTDPGVAEENIQARARGVVLMAVSNKFGSMLVTTGNKSELAVGYCTLYGDMAGGLAILSDVPKTMVYDLARWINTSPDSPLLRDFDCAVIPDDTITKPPSAELRPDQTDQDTLPPYDELDAIIERYVEREQSVRQIVAETGLDAEVVQRIARLIDRNEYKRKQAAPGIKVTGKAFGFGRRMPIAQRWDNRHDAVPTNNSSH